MLPPMKSTICYRSFRDNGWRTVDTISRGGKATRKYKNYRNIRNKETNQIECVDWKAEVKEWYMKNPEEVLLTGSKLPDMTVLEAKLNELDKWKKYEVYEEIPDNGQKTISVCWVGTEKNTEKGKVTKARLVARGYEEEDSMFRKDSRTCSKESLHMTLTIIASHGWKINCLDIQSAFLQGSCISKEIFLKPPAEATTKNLWKL